MPNHITNLIEATSTDVIDDMLNDKRDGIDFSKVTPLPKVLLESPYKAINVLANDIANTDDTVSVTLIGKANEETNKEVGSRINYRKACGFSSSYDFNIASWGTKWNGYDFNPERSGDDHVLFSTAWSTPYQYLTSLSHKYPEERISLTYADEDVGNNCGTVDFVAGLGVNVTMPNEPDVYDEDLYNAPVGSAVRFAIDLRGDYGPDDFNSYLNIFAGVNLNKVPIVTKGDVEIFKCVANFTLLKEAMDHVFIGVFVDMNTNKVIIKCDSGDSINITIQNNKVMFKKVPMFIIDKGAIIENLKGINARKISYSMHLGLLCRYGDVPCQEVNRAFYVVNSFIEALKGMYDLRHDVQQIREVIKQYKAMGLSIKMDMGKTFQFLLSGATEYKEWLPHFNCPDVGKLTYPGVDDEYFWIKLTKIVHDALSSYMAIKGDVLKYTPSKSETSYTFDISDTFSDLIETERLADSKVVKLK